MTKSYDILEVVITTAPDGSIIGIEVPKGVVVTVDHNTEDGEVDTRMVYETEWKEEAGR